MNNRPIQNASVYRHGLRQETLLAERENRIRWVTRGPEIEQKASDHDDNDKDDNEDDDNDMVMMVMIAITMQLSIEH